MMRKAKAIQDIWFNFLKLKIAPKYVNIKEEINRKAKIYWMKKKMRRWFKIRDSIKDI